MQVRSRSKVFLMIAFVWLASMAPFSAAATVGEFSIRDVLPLDQDQLMALRQLVRKEPETATIAANIAGEVEAKGLHVAEPSPIAVIHYEGLVNTDPRRIKTVSHLREMDHVALLMRQWQLTESADTAEALQRFILAWAGTYEPTGNDVNENKFYPLLVAYLALRNTFGVEDRARVDTWARAMAKHHVRAVRQSTHLTNRYGKHLRLTALFAAIFDNAAWQAAVEEGIQRFVNNSLYEDGSSYDLKHRDTLTYHMSALKPNLALAMLAGEAGRDLYTWEGERGGSLKKSVDYVIPYAMGEQVREEWKNSRVGLDKRRAEAGLAKYQPGSLFDPRDALEMMEDASFFDPDLMRVVAHLRSIDDARYASWQMLMNAAVERSQHVAAGKGGL